MNAKFGELIRSSTPVLVDFFATWCGPCQTLSPILLDLSRTMGDQVRVIKIDVDKNQQLASIYNVRSVPSMLLFQNGELKWRGAGVISVNELQKIIKQNTHANVD
jgi:thioredoxin 1